MKKNLMGLILMVLFFSVGVFSQTTEFTYQGDLQNGGSSANGSFDFEFLLFSAETGGTQAGSTLTRSPVTVTNGIFSVKLDFGANFPGANRFLEIHVKPTGGGAFTPLTPRQAVTSAPYSVTSLTAGNVTGVVSIANGGTGSPTQNFVDLTTVQSIGGNKIFSGSLSGNAVNSSTQYYIGGQRVLSVAGTSNLFAGVGAGEVNTTGSNNSFFGTASGFSNTSGNSNSFFGRVSGQVNTVGFSNSFFGDASGAFNTTGHYNSFLGYASGYSNTTGNENTMIGYVADVGTGNLTNATAIGARAFVTQSNSLVLGSINGVNGATADTNVGIGTTAPVAKLDVGGNINTSTQYNIGGFRVLTSGAAANTGANDFYAGPEAGQNATSDGYNNSFFGTRAGYVNTFGNGNSFFGAFSGSSNVNGESNSFFGLGAGIVNNDGSQNAFFGNEAGNTNTIGSSNTFVGVLAGVNNTTGSNNTIIGQNANVGANNLNNATAIGANAVVSQSNSLVLGSNANVGIGASAPSYKLEVVDASNTGLRVGTAASGGTVASFGSNGKFQIDENFVPGGRFTVLENGNVGIGNNNPADKLNVYGNVSFFLGSAGTTDVCQNASFQISTCGSSIRYKQNINPFVSGLSLIKQLRPVSFNWIANDQADMGLVAEEVAAVEPLLTTTNSKGEIEGVKYDRVGVVLVNAVKEQQTQIEAQQKQIDEQNEIIKKQRADLDALKALVCSQNPAAAVCKPQN